MDTTLTLDHFQRMTIPMLKDYLSSRGINTSGSKDTLSRNAYYAYTLNIPANNSERDEAESYLRDKKEKRLVNGCYFPDPQTLTTDWFTGSSYFPNVTYETIRLYLQDKNAGKAYRGGKSLFESGHVKEVRYHFISEHVSLCYIMCCCIPEQRTQNPVYDVWVMANKLTGEIHTADCNCVAGISGCCKHVGALLWHIEAEVKSGNNVACTSKPQEWHKPSKKAQKEYGPALMTDIILQKPKVTNILMHDKKTPLDRSNIDPRAEGQKNVSLTQKDIDELAEITNYDCGLVLLLQERNVNSAPNINDVALSVDVETSPTTILPIPINKVIENLENEVTFDEFLNLIKSDVRAIINLEYQTREQSKSGLWVEQRKWRVTASILYEVIRKVSPNFEIINALKSKTVVNNIRGCRSSFRSDATSWGIQNEPHALQIYQKSERKKHKSLSIQLCGLVIHPDLEIIGASPDGIIQCKCCNPRCLEIKCPWKHRGSTISDFVVEKGTCLVFDSEKSERIVLDKSHMYYTQVQCQMAVTGLKLCDFFVCTSKDYHVTQVPFDEEFWEMCMQKVRFFYREMIMPIVNEVVRSKKTIQDQEVHIDFNIGDI